MSKVVGTHLRRKRLDEFADEFEQGVNRAGGAFAQRGLQPGECLLDRIEVGRVGRQIAHAGADNLDRLADAGDLAGGVTSAAGPIINGHGFAADLAANTVLGGAAAVAGGGKFANGAITGAFGYMFNFAGNPANWAPAATWASRAAAVIDTVVGIIASPAVLLGAAINTVLTTSTAADDNGPQSVTLYRSIGAPELADIVKTGQFNFPPNGSEMKQFWLSPGNAQDFATIMNKLLGTDEYAHMVSVEVQQSTFAAGVPGTDPLNGTLRPYVTYDMTTLPLVNADARANGIQVLK